MTGWLSGWEGHVRPASKLLADVVLPAGNDRAGGATMRVQAVNQAPGRPKTDKA